MQGFEWLAAPQSRLAAVVLGALLLLFGRRLFWLFVGSVGFMVAYRLATENLHVHSPWVRLAAALLVGLGGVVLAIVLQRLAVSLAGFFVGVWAAASFLGIELNMHLGEQLGHGRGLILLAAGIVAALLAVWLFGLALIVLSSLTGAGLLADAAALHDDTTRLLLVLALLVVGVLVQSRGRSRAPAR